MDCEFDVQMAPQGYVPTVFDRRGHLCITPQDINTSPLLIILHAVYINKLLPSKNMATVINQHTVLFITLVRPGFFYRSEDVTALNSDAFEIQK